MVMFFLILALVFVVLLVIITNIVIVPQSKVYVVERLGSYSDTWTAGLHVKIPFIERIAKKVSLKEQVADFPPQPVITRDNVTMQIDTVVFFQVMDAKLYTYGVNQPIAAIESLSATTLRNIIGEMELDHTLTSRDVINGKITAILDEATDKWGIKVNRVELQDIIPPASVLQAMEKQMQAERNKRATILTRSPPLWRLPPGCPIRPCTAYSSATATQGQRRCSRITSPASTTRPRCWCRIFTPAAKRTTVPYTPATWWRA